MKIITTIALGMSMVLTTACDKQTEEKIPPYAHNQPLPELSTDGPLTPDRIDEIVTERDRAKEIETKAD